MAIQTERIWRCALLPGEMPRGVYVLAPGYEFRDLAGQLVDFKPMGVWLQPDRGFLTSAKHGRRPVFLHEIGNPVPGWLRGWTTTQHPDECDFWLGLLRRFDPNFQESV